MEMRDLAHTVSASLFPALAEIRHGSHKSNNIITNCTLGVLVLTPQPPNWKWKPLYLYSGFTNTERVRPDMPVHACSAALSRCCDIEMSAEVRPMMALEKRDRECGQNLMAIHPAVVELFQSDQSIAIPRAISLAWLKKQPKKARTAPELNITPTSFDNRFIVKSFIKKNAFHSPKNDLLLFFIVVRTYWALLHYFLTFYRLTDNLRIISKCIKNKKQSFISAYKNNYYVTCKEKLLRCTFV